MKKKFSVIFDMYNAKTSLNIKCQQIILAIIIGIGFLGISLPYPVITVMILVNEFFVMPSTISKVIILGAVISIYPFGQFLGSPILGSLSDYYGRKSILIFALMGTCIGYLITGYAVIAHNFYLFFFSRFLTGFFEGNIAISQAAVIDLHQSNTGKTKGMSLINSAVALGFILGPIIGGLLTELPMLSKELDFAFPFLLAGLLSVLALIFTFLFFQDTVQIHRKRQSRPFAILKAGVEDLTRNLISVFNNKKIKLALLVYALLYIGIDLFYEFYPFYFVTRWQFTVMQIALFSAVYTIPYMFSQMTFVQMAGSRFEASQILKYIGNACGATLILLPFFSNQSILYFFLPVLGIFISFCSTNVAVYLSNAADENNQGGCFGVSQSLRVFNNGLIAIFGGIFGSIVVGMPFLIGGLAIIFASGILLFRESINGNYVE